MGYNFATGFQDEKCEAVISGQSVTLEMIGNDSSAVPMSMVVFGKTGRNP